MKELREEIKNVIKIIAQEYIEQYPVATVDTAYTALKRSTSNGMMEIYKMFLIQNVCL